MNNLKTGQLIYIKHQVALIPHIEGYKAVIVKINKKDKIDYSIKVNIQERFSTLEGISIKNNESLDCFKLNSPNYEFFDDMAEFKKSMILSFNNAKLILDKAIEEITNNFN